MKLGFSGLGNMGEAILRGILTEEVLPAAEIGVSRAHPQKMPTSLSEVQLFADNPSMAASCESILLAVKPNVLSQVLSETAPHLRGKLIISIAAGWTPEKLCEALPESRIICVMPNVPVSVGAGTSIINESGRYTPEDMTFVQNLFGAIGETMIVPNRIYAASGSLTGCGPAYAFEFMEALCDAAVRSGIPKQQAKEMTAMMLLGAAQMVLKTGKHPCELKDQVCSPGGTTIEGIYALHQGGFHTAVMNALDASIQKGNKLN